MKQHSDIVELRSGVPLAGVDVLVLDDQEERATLYAGRNISDGTIANPVRTNESGEFSFYAPDGRYSLEVWKDGVLIKRYPDKVLLEDQAGKLTALTSAVQSLATLTGIIGEALDAARDWINSVATSAGASLVGFIQDATGAVARTVQDDLRDRVSVFRFMTLAQIADVKLRTRLLDVTTPIQNAVDAARHVTFPDGDYKITAPITLTNNGQTLEFQNANTTIVKAFNGEAFQVSGGNVYFERLGLDGQGGTYTGGGIRALQGGAIEMQVQQARIKNTADSCVIFEKNAGQFSVIADSYIQPLTVDGYSVRHDGAMDDNPTHRHITNCDTGGCYLINVASMETTLIEGNTARLMHFGGGGASSTKKAIIIGNRFTSAGENLVVYGMDHVIVGNCIAAGIEAGPGATNCRIGCNATLTGVAHIDSSGNGTNYFEQYLANWTCAWTSASNPQPSLGNGTVTSSYSRVGRRVTVDVAFTFGSTTTFGTGAYTFSLPFASDPAKGIAVGSVRAVNSGVAYKIGSVMVSAGGTSCSVYFEGTTTAMSPTVPHTWKNGDSIQFSLSYELPL